MASGETNFSALTEKTTPESSDVFLLEDTTATKKVKFSNLFSAILDQLTTKTFSGLQTTAKNIIGAVNETRTTANTAKSTADTVSARTIPSGGTAGQILSKNSNTNYDTQWIDPPSGSSDSGGTSDYNDLTNKPQIGGVALTGNKTLDQLGIQPKGNYLTTVPQANSTTFGGIKAKAKTTETVEAAIGTDGKLYVPTYPSAGGAAENGLPSGGTTGQILKKKSGTNYDVEWSDESDSSIPRQEMQSTDTTVTLQPNVLYVFPEMASLTVTLATPSNTNIANEWHFFFTSGTNPTTLTLNDVLSDAYSIEANMKYEVSILEGVAYIKGVTVNEA